MKDLITIDEVCEIARISKPTVYRRVKMGTFPKPKKIKAPNVRGPNKVNRWERGEVMGWLLKGNDPKWLSQPVKDLKASTAKLKKAPITSGELAKELEPGLNALFGKEALQPDDAARYGEGATDLYDYEPVEEPSKTKRHVAQAVIVALLIGVAVMIFS
ncbi:MAG: helix-turn-helix transcriptional regulator [Alphaproteobacteria bacterium]